MTDRGRWAGVIERFIEDLELFDFPGGRLDVRENVRFRGGACAAWAHRMFPEEACVLSIEVKKFFMDEWTGGPIRGPRRCRRARAAHVPGALEELVQL